MIRGVTHLHLNLHTRALQRVRNVALTRYRSALVAIWVNIYMLSNMSGENQSIPAPILS